MKRSLIAMLVVAGLSVFAADDVTVQVAVSAQAGYLQVLKSPGAVKATWSAPEYVSATLDVTTNGTAFIAGDVNTPGYLFLRNVGTHETVLVSLDSSGIHLALKPGEFALLRLAPSVVITDISAATTNGTTRLEYLLLGD